MFELEDKMKRVVIMGALIALCLSSFSCGGGAGDAQVPTTTVSSGVPSLVQLLPVRSIAQTNSFLAFKVKVLDGNGMPVPNIPVIFTNLSLLGSLSAPSATTDVTGLASVTLYSTTAGFATVEAEVNTGVGVVRDRKTVFFDSRNISEIPSRGTTGALLVLDVDDGDGTFNEPDDFTMLKNPNDNTRNIRATLTQSGSALSGVSVTFGADRPFKTSPGGKCSDGSSNCDVIFPSGNVKTTDNAGQATVTMQVIPASLDPITSVLNITASTTSPVSSNVVSLFLKPVTISAVSVSANPLTVASGGTSAISANVTTSAGTPAPDGTTVNFAVTSGTGGVDPFAQTTNGIAQAKFQAPTLAAGAFNETDTITASVGGKSGSTNVTVTAPPPPTPTPTPTPTPVPALAVTPTTASLHCGSAATATFFITGGVPPYTITKAVSSDPVTPSPTTVSASGGSFTVSAAAFPCAGPPPLPASTSANILVKDNVNTIVAITVTVTNP
jgi:hypothetical protein